MGLPQPGPPVNGTEERLDVLLHEIRCLRAELQASQIRQAQQMTIEPGTVDLQEPLRFDAPASADIPQQPNAAPERRRRPRP